MEQLTSNEELQASMDLSSLAYHNFDLTISTKKAEVLYQPAPGKPCTEPIISVSNQKLSATDMFSYLGSTLSRAMHIDEEINIRIAKASAAFGRLRDSVSVSKKWHPTGEKNSRSTKLWLYQLFCMGVRPGQSTSVMPGS
ncbi:hypothetical protein JOB18_001309 [Solea senegalensis]|uniref:Uncharacterized protein n=1 Tax=Solea senegalensis TaxID=28829 RepID=A0AAV6PGV8_SOLSE|nr:hypothetical protein JOB18_001309 [Solea senegalensis]